MAYVSQTSCVLPGPCPSKKEVSVGALSAKLWCTILLPTLHGSGAGLQTPLGNVQWTGTHRQRTPIAANFHPK
eukprot:2765302-Amphidinium_carterae.3